MSENGHSRQAVFLDRDGTLIEEVGYLHRVEQVSLFPWTIDAVRLLNRAGFRVVMTTNQAGVARGYFTESAVMDVHRHIESMLAAGGARLDGWFYCPHHPEGKVEPYNRHCDCRKPGRGMVDRAAEELGIDPLQSAVVGDRWLDVRLARAVGARALLVRTGYGAAEEAHPEPELAADVVCDNLMSATTWILRFLRSAA